MEDTIKATEAEYIAPCDNCISCFNFHGDITESICDNCKVIIAEKENIFLPNKYRCSVCNKLFRTKTLFLKHKHCEFERNFITFICESCDLIWREEEPFTQHMNRKHNNHLCKRCKLKVEGKDNLDEHFRTKHKAF